jgi:hypothetical protein
MFSLTLCIGKKNKNMIKTATVTLVGKFYKVITNTGDDISNQIERPMRKKAIELGKGLEFDTQKSCWKISGVSNVTTAIPVMKKAKADKKSAIEELEAAIVDAKPKRQRKVYDTVEMPKPKWAPGDIVHVDFIGTRKKVVLSEIKKNPQNSNRWIYTGVEVGTGLVIPYIGIENTEQFANIVVEEEIAE